MMKRLLVISLGLVLVFALTVTAIAEDSKDKKMTQEEACALMGNCGNDMVSAAKSMQAECEKMMAKATALMEKGKMILGQGQLWQDKEMEAEGKAIYEQGKKMYDDAKTMSDTCSLIIAEGEKIKNKSAKIGEKPKDKKESQPKGDTLPK